MLFLYWDPHHLLQSSSYSSWSPTTIKLSPGILDISLQDNGTGVVAADGLFGLPRRKSSGSSYESPRHGEKYFANQADVDRFVLKPISTTEVK
jgi:hypothetical protein